MDRDYRRYREDPGRYREPDRTRYRPDPYRDETRRYRDERYRESERYRDAEHYRDRGPSQPQRSGGGGGGGGRPPQKKKKKKSPLSNPLIYLLMVCGVSAILACVGWTLANDVLALNKDEGTATIVVKEDKDFGNVVKQLKKNGIINYKWTFRLFAALTGGEEKVAQGTYNLHTDMDYRAILNALSSRSGNRVEASVTIPEGYSCKEIFALLQEEGVSTVEKLEDMAANHNYAFSFLQEIPMGDPYRLEGYLFPDTYIFYMGEDPKIVLNKMLVNFDAKFTEAMRQQVADSGRTVREIVNIASMIEKESDGTDRAKIASVIYNRLNNPGAGTNGLLQIDATIQYVFDQEAPYDQKKEERRMVTQADYQTVSSPYNTYLNKGLPPGPICNPGIDCLLAAINPENTNYYYYALGSDKVHHFFNTLSQHQAFLASQG